MTEELYTYEFFVQEWTRVREMLGSRHYMVDNPALLTKAVQGLTLIFMRTELGVNEERIQLMMDLLLNELAMRRQLLRKAA